MKVWGRIKDLSTCHVGIKEEIKTDCLEQNELHCIVSSSLIVNNAKHLILSIIQLYVLVLVDRNVVMTKYCKFLCCTNAKASVLQAE